MRSAHLPPAYAGRLSVLLPLGDDLHGLGRRVAEIEAALAGQVPVFEIVCVDDGRRDATPLALARAARRHPRLRVLRLAAGCGPGPALWLGVQAARHPWVATLDGAGRHDPADIPRLLAALRPPGPALVVGWRPRCRDGGLRRAASGLAAALRARLLRDPTPDPGCALRLFAREAFLGLPFLEQMHRFVPALMRRDGWAVASVPVRVRAPAGVPVPGGAQGAGGAASSALARATALAAGSIARAAAGRTAGIAEDDPPAPRLLDLAGVLWLLRQPAPTPPPPSREAHAAMWPRVNG